MAKIKRTKLLNRTYNTRDAQLFIIATEGAKTEKRYFSMFQKPSIKIEVLATDESNKSAPEYVKDRLNEFAQKYDLGKEDSLWLVFDVDRWPEKNLISVCREARQKNYCLAISNPCFEVWLCLHFTDLDPKDVTAQDFKSRLRLLLGSYNSSNLDVIPFQKHIQDAIQRAKTLHPNANQHWPATPGSHVYRVVEMILKAMKKYNF